jgi:FkbM family methyltransferase
LPRRVSLRDSVISLDAPSEPGLSNDYVNIWLDDEYGLRSLASAPSRIVDIGANIGLFSLWASRNYPKAIIHAYEPSESIAAYAERNLASRPQVQLYRSGVSSKAGFAQLVQAGESRVVRAVGGASDGVPMLPFADVVARMGGPVDLLKLDCEGAEWDIFADPNPFRDVQVVRMEYHLIEGRTVQDVRQAAEDLGFQVEKLIENDGFGIAWWKRR